MDAVDRVPYLGIAKTRLKDAIYRLMQDLRYAEAQEKFDNSVEKNG